MRVWECLRCRAALCVFLCFVNSGVVTHQSVISDLFRGQWEVLTTDVLIPVCQEDPLRSTSSCVGGEDGTQARLALLTVTASVNAALQGTGNVLNQLQSYQSSLKSQIGYSLPCNTAQDPPLSCSLQMGWMDSVIKRTSVWRNNLKVNENMLHTENGSCLR